MSDSDSESVAKMTAKLAKVGLKVSPVREEKVMTFHDYSQVPFPTRVRHIYKKHHVATADWVGREDVRWGINRYKTVTAFVIAHNKVLHEQGKHPAGCQEGIWQNNNTEFLKDGIFIPIKSIVTVGTAPTLEETPAPGSVVPVAPVANGGGGGGGGGGGVVEPIKPKKALADVAKPKAKEVKEELEPPVEEAKPEALVVAKPKKAKDEAK